MPYASSRGTTAARLVSIPSQGRGPDPISAKDAESEPRPPRTGPVIPRQRQPVDEVELAPAWRPMMLDRLRVTDTLTVLLVVFSVQVLWLGPQWGYPVAGELTVGGAMPTYTALGVLIAAGWLVALAVSGSRSPRVFGEGVEEYRRVLTASVWLFGLLAVLAYSLRYDIARGYVAIAFPVGLGALCLERWAWRRWLMARRQRGAMLSRVLVVGTQEGAAPLARHIDRLHTTGMKVVGLVRTSGRDLDPAQVLAEATDRHANAVVVTQSAQLEPSQLRDLRWQLEELGADLVIAPALTGLAGQRVHMRPVEGISLLHVDGARYDGSMRLVKGLFDRFVAGVGLLLLGPLLVMVAVAVRLTSAGPAFYRQERIGLDGEAFHIWKFRSMTQGADAQLAALIEEHGEGTPQFKLTDDARVTSLGHYLRKWSIDELPQLFNVLRGDMSLVGPRPQRPAEVALYDYAAVRRLRVKPGLTGLWQVSGRSDIPWDRAVELDLYYVENWSLFFDLQLLWRTASAVVKGAGAY